MLDLLNALSKNELASFEKFLCSPYYNQSSRMIKFYKSLRSKLKNRELGEPTREEIFEMAFDSKKYSDVKYRRLVSEFTRLFEKYLAVIRFESKNYLQEIVLLEELDKRRIDRLFEPGARSLLKKLSKSISRDDEYYSVYSNLLSLLVYYYYGKDPDKAAEFLQAKSENIDLNFVFIKLHLFHEMIVYNDLQNIKKEFNFDFYDEITRFIRKNEPDIKDHHPNLYVIFLTMQMYNDDGNKYSGELLQYLGNLKDTFPKEKLTYYYTYITSFYWNRINKGNQQYRKSLFDTYKKMVKEDMLLLDKYLTDNMFNSIIMIGISQKEFDWTEEFIERYKGKVEPSKAKDAVNLAYAKIFFYRKNYNDAVNYLKNVEFKNTIYFTNSKILLAKIYYDKNELTSVDYLLDSLNHYIKRNKQLVPEQVLLIKTFLKYMRELVKYKEDKKKNAVVLKKEMDNEKNHIPDRNWFYEKINELGKNISVY